VGVEYKYFDSGKLETVVPLSFATAVFNPATLNCLNCPDQGTGVQQRDGRSIFQHSITVNYAVHWRATAGSTNGVVFPPVMIAVVLDTQCNQTALTAADNIFTNPSGDPGTLVVPFRDMEYTNRFKVLCRKLINPSAGSGQTDPGSATNYSRHGYYKAGFLYCNLKGLKTMFNANAKAVTDISDNALHMIAICPDQDVNQSVHLSYQARLMFTSG